MAGGVLDADQQAKALALVAEWLGPRMGYAGPCESCGTSMDDCFLAGDDTCCARCDRRHPPASAPTGDDAAYRALGPALNREWDWPSGGPTPTILLEGGPYDWAIDVSLDDEMIEKFREIGVFAEPYSGWALCLYRR